jgi:hypothetical protein
MGRKRLESCRKRDENGLAIFRPNSHDPVFIGIIPNFKIQDENGVFRI